MDEDEGVQEESSKEEEDDGPDDADWRKMDSSGQRLIPVLTLRNGQ